MRPASLYFETRAGFPFGNNRDKFPSHVNQECEIYISLSNQDLTAKKSEIEIWHS